MVCALGIVMLWSTLRGELRVLIFGRTTEGVVMQVDRPRTRTAQWTPTIRFYDGEGDAVTFQGLAQRSGTYSVGQRVPVRYATGNPAVAYVDTWATLYLGLVIGLVAGVGMAIGGGAMVRAARRIIVT